MSDVTAMSTGLCAAAKRSGGLCKYTAGWGTNHPGVGRCKFHGGSTPSHELNGQVVLARRDYFAMGRPIEVDPTEAILECIRIAAGEVQYASERISEIEHSEIVGKVETSRPLKEEKGAENPSIYVTEFGAPALHIWVKVRHDAMDRLVNYSKAAVAAGIAERQIRIAEGQAQQLAELMRRFAEAMGHDPADPKVREAMRGSLTLIAGGVAA